MRNGQVRVLVATDVAARGIDVRGISHVINFDLPKFPEDYVHRIGRTGRGGSTGIAISFASNRDAQMLKRIERYTEQTIKMHTIEGLEPNTNCAPARLSDRPRSNSGPRRSGGFGAGKIPGFGGNRTGGFPVRLATVFLVPQYTDTAGIAMPDGRKDTANGMDKEANGNTLGVGGGQGFGGSGAAQPRSQDRSFGNNRGAIAHRAATAHPRPALHSGRGKQRQHPLRRCAEEISKRRKQKDQLFPRVFYCLTNVRGTFSIPRQHPLARKTYQHGIHRRRSLATSITRNGIASLGIFNSRPGQHFLGSARPMQRPPRPHGKTFWKFMQRWQSFS